MTTLTTTTAEKSQSMMNSKSNNFIKKKNSRVFDRFFELLVLLSDQAQHTS